jgi:hypothetical protein
MTDGDLLRRLANRPMSSSNNLTNLSLSDAPRYLAFGVDISPCFDIAESYIAILGLEEKGIVAYFRV